MQTITVLDLAGDGASLEAKTRSERLRASVENWLRAGALAGIGRVEVSFGDPPKEARFELTTDMLVMALGPDAAPASLGLSDETLNPGGLGERAIQRKRLPHPVTPWPRFLEETAAEGARQGGGH